MNRLVIIIACFLTLAILAAIQAPAFLIVSDTLVKSDAVVLFIGNDRGTREKEARQLMHEGFAEYLIIPAYRQVKTLNPDGSLSKIGLRLTPNHVKPKTASWLEDTHQEAIVAKAMMEQLGLRSAILVSSLYHMRRIKLISERVFAEKATVRYVPTRYETPREDSWLFDSYERKQVFTEYVKIAWFVLYSPFV